MSYVILETNKGRMELDLFDKETPITAKNFKDLVSKGFYDGLTFHRVIPNFVIQGGCPDGTGAGGPGYTIPCEVTAEKQYHDKGALSMAHAGPNTGGSQFFICHSRENTAHLDGVHTVFGQLRSENFDVLDSIEEGDTIIKATLAE